MAGNVDFFWGGGTLSATQVPKSGSTGVLFGVQNDARAVSRVTRGQNIKIKTQDEVRESQIMTRSSLHDALTLKSLHPYLLLITHM